MQEQRKSEHPSGSEEELSDDEADSFLRMAAGIPGESDAGRAGSGSVPRILHEGAIIAKRYRLDRRLGEGGMGVVWAATHTVTRRPCALKVLKSATWAHDELRRRFLREGRIAGAIDHPNVVEVHDVFELDDGTPAMVMPLLSGETLRVRIDRQQRLEVAQTVAVLLPVASAVAAAHALGIVHRDLKPENIFLAEGEAPGEGVKVLDFGVAKVEGGEGSAGETDLSTGTGTVLGTACYMAPEQALAEKDVDSRADIWALGVILYECLSGTRPIKGSSVGQVVADMMSRNIEPLESLLPGLPRDLADMVGRMLARDRGKRPESLAEVIEVLARHQGGTALDSTARGSSPQGDRGALAATIKSQSRPTTRGTVLSALVVAGLVTAAFFFFGAGRAGVPSETPPPVQAARETAPSSPGPAPARSIVSRGADQRPLAWSSSMAASAVAQTAAPGIGSPRVSRSAVRTGVSRLGIAPPASASARAPQPSAPAPGSASASGRKGLADRVPF